MAVAFDKKRRLGNGYFGEVWLAVDTGLQCEVALKIIPPHKIINQANFFQEAQVLKTSEHPNIVRVNDTGTMADGSIYVSMEYLRAGSVEDLASGAPLPFSRAKRLMIDVLRGLHHAHTQNIVHRDVKPANILIGPAGEAKLSDFGLAIPKGNVASLAQLKQYEYALHLAPEVRRIQDYSPRSDVYAAGVTLYRLINGDGALPSLSPADAHVLAKKGEFPPRDGYRDYVPQSWKRLINKSLNVMPAARFQSADEMRRALEHLPAMTDWSVSESPGVTVWNGQTAQGHVYQLTKRLSSAGQWQIEFKSGTNTSALRRRTQHCDTYGSRRDADRHCRRILQDYVVGRN